MPRREKIWGLKELLLPGGEVQNSPRGAVGFAHGGGESSLSPYYSAPLVGGGGVVKFCTHKSKIEVLSTGNKNMKNKRPLRDHFLFLTLLSSLDLVKKT